MDQLFGSFLKFSFIWGLPVFIVLLVVAGYVDHRIGKGHKWGWPKTWPLRGAKVLLVLVQVVSISMLVMMLGPMREAVAAAKRVHSKIGEIAPDLTFRQVSDDTELSLHGFDGDVRVVNLWATWCPPCLVELPDLDRLQKAYGDQGLTVVTLSEQSRLELQAFEAKHPYSMTNVYTDQMDWLDVGDARPVTIIIDRQGVVREFFYAMRDFAAFEAMIRPYL